MNDTTTPDTPLEIGREGAVATLRFNLSLIHI